MGKKFLGVAPSATTHLALYESMTDHLTRVNFGIATRSITSNVTITAVTAEQLITAFTIPANSLAVGDVIVMHAEGYATQTSASAAHELRVRCGSAANVAALTANIVAGGAATLALARTAIPFFLHAEMTVRTTGGSGTMFGEAEFGGQYFLGATNGGAVGITAAATVDTTASRDIAFTYKPTVNTVTAFNIVSNRISRG